MYIVYMCTTQIFSSNQIFFYNFRNIGIVILVAGFATVFVALMYCTCICKEGRRVAPDGSPQNVSKLKIEMSLVFIFSRQIFWPKHFKKGKSCLMSLGVSYSLTQYQRKESSDFKTIIKNWTQHFSDRIRMLFSKMVWNLKITCN